MIALPALTIGNVVVLVFGVLGASAIFNGFRIADPGEILFGVACVVIAWFVVSLGGPIV